MDQSYVYEEEEAEGITFKKIGHFFKKGWVRMIIYAVACLAVASVVFLPIKFFYKSEPMARTSVEFIYKGIEKGEDPNGGTFNADDIKTPTVVSKAAAAAGLSEVVTDISVLRGAMRIEPVTTKEYDALVAAAEKGDANAISNLAAYNFYPTRFNIIISDPKSLGLSDAQAKQLLDHIVNEYYEQFKSEYSVPSMFSESIYDLSGNTTWEFTDIYDEYLVTLNNISNELAKWVKEAPTFVSTKANARFDQLAGQLSALRLEYESFNNFVLGKNIWRDKNLAYKNLLNAKEQVASSITTQENLAKALSDQIGGINPTSVTAVTGGTTTKTESYPEEYYAYQDKLTTVNELIASLNTRQSNLAIRIKTVTDGEETPVLPLADSSDADIAAAKTALEGIETKSAEFVKKVNAAIADYYDTTLVSSSVKKVSPAIVTRTSSTISIMIVYVVAAIIGLLAASVVTGVKIFKANAAAAETTAAEDVPSDKESK